MKCFQVVCNEFAASYLSVNRRRQTRRKFLVNQNNVFTFKLSLFNPSGLDNISVHSRVVAPRHPHSSRHLLSSRKCKFVRVGYEWIYKKRISKLTPRESLRAKHFSDFAASDRRKTLNKGCPINQRPFVHYHISNSN